MTSTEHYFAADGELAQALEHFTPREQQSRLAVAIEQALNDESVLIAEAGTGTGKTFAYLVPAILSGKKIIISTGTKSLQDQLFHRDLPLIIAALKMPLRTALLKGRANYLCHYRMQLHAIDGSFHSREILRQFYKIREQVPQTRHGDIAEISGISADSPVWSAVTSTADNCLGSDCEFYDKCHLVQARREAMAADIVVVNHHLFFADSMIKAEGFGELLPGAQAVIFDEAHQLPDVATQFFGTSLSSRQLTEIAYDLSREVEALGGDMQDITDVAHELLEHVKACRQALGPSMGRFPWRETQSLPDLAAAFAAIQEDLTALKDEVSAVTERAASLQQCEERLADLIERFDLLTKAQSHQIQWWENFAKSFTLHLTPLSIANEFQRMMDKPCTWIFTSATLAVGEDFSHFQQECGIAKAKTLHCPSPFDYQNQALCYCPRNIPDPRAKDYADAIIDAAIPVIKASQGGVFFLFTSHQALKIAAERLRAEIDYPLLIQGDASSEDLLKQFRQSEQAVLLGSYSFWEGVDVKGHALRAVIIDRLPFENPNDPILQARVDVVRKEGGDPFKNFQLPKAVIALKQGCGRLLRDSSDKGILMLCDPRILARFYAQLFWSSLPAMTITRRLNTVSAFLEDCRD